MHWNGVGKRVQDSPTLARDIAFRGHKTSCRFSSAPQELVLVFKNKIMHNNNNNSFVIPEIKNETLIVAAIHRH